MEHPAGKRPHHVAVNYSASRGMSSNYLKAGTRQDPMKCSEMIWWVSAGFQPSLSSSQATKINYIRSVLSTKNNILSQACVKKKKKSCLNMRLLTAPQLCSVAFYEWDHKLANLKSLRLIISQVQMLLTEHAPSGVWQWNPNYIFCRPAFTVLDLNYVRHYE